VPPVNWAALSAPHGEGRWSQIRAAARKEMDVTERSVPPGTAPGNPGGDSSPKAIRLYFASRPELTREDLLRELEADRSLFMLEARLFAYGCVLLDGGPCDFKDAAQALVLNTGLRLSPNFRYCVAKRLNLTEEADAPRDAAAHWLSRAPQLYREAWGDVVEPELYDHRPARQETPRPPRPATPPED